MTQIQRVIKYAAIAFAVALVIGIVSGIVTALAQLLAPHGEPVGEMADLPVSGAIESLRIDVGAADLVLQTGDSLTVQSNNDRISATVKNGTLHIEESSSWFNVRTAETSLILTVPEDKNFRSVDIDAGAGKITVESLSADTLELDLGAGDVEIHRLTVAHSAEINGGAGRITVGSGSVRDLDFDAGVGEVSIRTALTGESEINMGIGKVDITLLGTEADYTLSIDKGIGSATFNGAEMSGGTRYGSGSNRLDIDGGIGEIRIRTESVSN